MSDSEKSMNGRVALVTGASTGIGRASAIALAARGAHALVVGRDAQRAEEVLDTIRGNGGKADFCSDAHSQFLRATGHGRHHHLRWPDFDQWARPGRADKNCSVNGVR